MSWLERAFVAAGGARAFWENVARFEREQRERIERRRLEDEQLTRELAA